MELNENKRKLLLIIANRKFRSWIDGSVVNQCPCQMSTIGIYDWH